MNTIQLDIDQIVKAVKDELTKPEKIWDNYVPILETDERLTVFLTEGIASPPEYNEACYRIANADRPVTLVLCTPGGSSATAFMFLNAMEQCKFPIHGRITGEVASAGTIITMRCDTIEVDDFSHFMVHNYSHGAHGSGAQVKDYVDFVDSEFAEAAKVIYKDFLTEDEMTMVSRQDKELWMGKTEVLERWARKQGEA